MFLPLTSVRAIIVILRLFVCCGLARDDGQGTVQRLLQSLLDCGLLEATDAATVGPQSTLSAGLRLCQHVTETQMYEPQQWLALERSLVVSGGLHKKVWSAFRTFCMFETREKGFRLCFAQPD
jgi:hypothetical protein